MHSSGQTHPWHPLRNLEEKRSLGLQTVTQQQQKRRKVQLRWSQAAAPRKLNSPAVPKSGAGDKRLREGGGGLTLSLHALAVSASPGLERMFSEMVSPIPIPF